jgi:hypothetical protein
MGELGQNDVLHVFFVTFPSQVVLEERTEAVQEQYLLRTMRQMLKERAKRYVKGSTVDLKPATNVPLYSKTIRADRVL